MNKLEVDVNARLHGYQAGDILIEVSKVEEKKFVNKYRVVGLSENENLVLENLKTGEQGEPISIAALFLIERPSLCLRLGTQVIARSGKAKKQTGIVRVINPETEELLVEFVHFSKGNSGEKYKGEVWFPRLIKLQEKHCLWLKVSELEQFNQKEIVESASVQSVAVSSEIAGEQSWVDELYEKKQAQYGHVFLLNGNVFDLQRTKAGRYLTLQQYLEEIFEKREIFMYYCMSAGLQFKNVEMEKIFRSAYLPKPKPQAAPARQNQTSLQNWNAQVNGSRRNVDSVGAENSLAQKFGKAQDDTPLHKLIGRMPEEVFPVLEKALVDYCKVPSIAAKKRKVLVIDYAENIFPEDSGQSATRIDRLVSETLLRWAQDPRIKDSGNLIFIITPNLEKISKCLRSGHTGIVQLRVPKPTIEQRTKRWNYLQSVEGVKFEQDLTAKMLGNSTNGLSLRQIDEVNRLSRVQKKEVGLSFIRNRKQSLLQSEIGWLIDVLNPEFGFEHFGGRPELIDYLMKMQYYMLNGIYRRVPVGILMPGPPGTGKSLLWQCFAHEAGLNCVSIKTLRDIYVGSGEQRTDLVLSSIDDLQPVVVIEDEADQSESSRDDATGDSGVSNRIRKKKFEFCADPRRRGRVIWVRLTNRQDLLDSAYRRKGRTDEVIPFCLPEVDDMAAIFDVKFKEYGIMTSISDFYPFSRAAKERIYITGADIDWIVRESDMLAADDNQEIVTENYLFQAIDDWEMQTDPADIDRQLIMALRAGSKRFRPKGWETMMAEAQARLRNIREPAIYPGSGGSFNPQRNPEFN